MAKDRTVEAWCYREELLDFKKFGIRAYPENKDRHAWPKFEIAYNPVRLTITIHEEEDNAHT